MDKFIVKLCIHCKEKYGCELGSGIEQECKRCVGPNQCFMLSRYDIKLRSGICDDCLRSINQKRNNINKY